MNFLFCVFLYVPFELNKGRLQKLICTYLTELAQNVNTEIIYSVGSHCTNLSTKQPMQNYRFDQSEADTILFSAYTVIHICELCYSGPVVIDAADTDAYVAAAFILQQLAGMLHIKRKQAMVLCHGLVTEEMADCIMQPTQDPMAMASHQCMTRLQTALWLNSSSRSVEKALTLKSKQQRSFLNSQDM